MFLAALLSLIALNAAAVSNGVYTLTSKHSGKLAEVASASLENGANISQWPANGHETQNWIITHEGNNYYSIVNANSGKAMEIYDWQTADGANVAQYAYWGGDSQLWAITDLGNGHHSIINKYSGKALDLLNFDTADGANIAQWSYWGGDAQQWALTQVGSVGEPPLDTSTTNGAVNHWSLTGNLGTHDPSMAWENNQFWLFQTGPGIYGKVSSDGLHWEPLPAVFPNGLSWWKNYVPDQEGIDVWAPDIEYYNGRYWLYYSISTFGSKVSAIGLASTNSIAGGNWTDHGMVISTNNANDYNAIDPDLVIDANGAPWLTFGSWNTGIKVVRLNPMTMKPIGDLHSVAANGQGIEAPTLIYRQGFYYLFVSVGTCCQGVNSGYHIRYGRSTSVTGPFLDKNGADMLYGGGSLLDGGNSVWVGPGGEDILNTDVIVRHAYDATDNGAPKLLISTLNWDSSGWPRY
ncbi:RICIN domain-containing protein [Microbulbifer sp. YPW1]|uniref:RICIN domain-containing protein n=1 Tax=Microbulbifer sp. YPW1 TaxID=2745199 RepID=UPI001597A4B6|nr:RICIN domain-containing protein [Microbulbifer sp. YPW1]QKX16103.1 RICIN domain-containing protein [Microbulbifer sp. YPW1]